MFSFVLLLLQLSNFLSIYVLCEKLIRIIIICYFIKQLIRVTEHLHRSTVLGWPKKKWVSGGQGTTTCQGSLIYV